MEKALTTGILQFYCYEEFLFSSAAILTRYIHFYKHLSNVLFIVKNQVCISLHIINTKSLKKKTKLEVAKYFLEKEINCMSRTRCYHHCHPK